MILFGTFCYVMNKLTNVQLVIAIFPGLPSVHDYQRAVTGLHLILNAMHN